MSTPPGSGQPPGWGPPKDTDPPRPRDPWDANRQPDAAQPGAAQPEAAQPEAAQPGGAGSPGWGPAGAPGSGEPPGWGPPPAPTQLPSGWTPPPPSGWTQQPPPAWNQPPPAGYGAQQPPGYGAQPPPGYGAPPQPGWTPAQPYGYGPAGWQQPAKRDSRLPVVLILLLVGALIVAVVVGIIVLGSSLGALTGSNLQNIAVGQCFDGGRAVDTTSTPIVPPVEMVDCAQPHESEMAASFEYPGVPADGEYPGEDRMSSYSESECTLRFAGYVGVPFSQSIYGMTYAYPLEMNWLLGDRSIQCIAHPPVGQETMTGSVRNARR